MPTPFFHCILIRKRSGFSRLPSAFVRFFDRQNVFTVLIDIVTRVGDGEGQKPTKTADAVFYVVLLDCQNIVRGIIGLALVGERERHPAVFVFDADLRLALAVFIRVGASVVGLAVPTATVS